VRMVVLPTKIGEGPADSNLQIRNGKSNELLDVRSVTGYEFCRLRHGRIFRECSLKALA